jgi:Tol biopolymer transport system component
VTCVNGTDIESDVYTINVDGSGEARLTDTPGLDGMPTWSPGGSRIAFVSGGTKDNSNIYVMNSDGSGLTKLTDTLADDAFPAGRP